MDHGHGSDDRVSELTGIRALGDGQSVDGLGREITALGFDRPDERNLHLE